MTLKSNFLALALLLAGLAHAGVKLPKPHRASESVTAEHKALIAEGVQFHDRGQFIKAIERYDKVLEESPWVVEALHEKAYSQFMANDYERSFETARKGAECQSSLLPLFHMMMGNALDEMGRTPEALEVYKQAVKANPGVGLLHFNLAVSYLRAKKMKETKVELQHALRLTPKHPSSQRLMGGIYMEGGQRIPAIMAYTRFLITEPVGVRTTQILASLDRLLAGGVTKGAGSNQINIVIGVGPNGKSDGEGDFSGAEMMLSIGVASQLMKVPDDEVKKPKNQFGRLVSIYDSLGESLQGMPPKGGFAASYYAPYFAALSKEGHIPAMVAYVFQSGNVEGLAEWEKENRPELHAFLNWDSTYIWPTK